MSPITMVLMAVGLLFVYAAIKNLNPFEFIRSIIGSAGPKEKK